MKAIGPNLFHHIVIVPYEIPESCRDGREVMDWGDLRDYWDYQVEYWRSKIKDGKVMETDKGFAIEVYKYFDLGRCDAWRWWWSEVEPWVGGYVDPQVFQEWRTESRLVTGVEAQGWKLPSHPAWGNWGDANVRRPKLWVEGLTHVPPREEPKLW